ncbi:MAG TPA: M20/M25/M40 family metallo-hydrolase [Gammaproteobacteria bacterium]|nr:M20/M25/M40 family metallo-hydrolase [Gammaproteobacteria bacterium]
MKKFLLIILNFFLMNYSYASALSPTEKNMVEYLKKEKNSQIVLLEKLVSINSGTTNVVGVKKVGEILRPQFEKLGFKTQWVKLPPPMKHAGTLIATHSGHGKNILLIGHLDTVFPKNSKFQKFSRKGNFAKGPGVIDDKGGVVVILYALKALNHAKALKNAAITVVLVGDEEDSAKPTSISRKSLIDIGKKSAVALDFEPSSGLHTIAVGRRGISSFTIKTTGIDAHSSLIFSSEIGDGAIYELARIIDAIRIQLKSEKYLVYSPAMILGGTDIKYVANFTEGTAQSKKNIVAKNAMVHSDLRFVSEEQRATAENIIKKIVAEHLPKTKASVTFQSGIPAMPIKEGNQQLLKKYRQVSLDLGQGAVLPLGPEARGAGDISHVAAFVPQNLIGLGPVGYDMHSEQESVVLSTLPIAAARAAILIHRISLDKIH